LISPLSPLLALSGGRREWRLLELEVRTIGGLVLPLWALTYKVVRKIARGHFLQDPTIRGGIIGWNKHFGQWWPCMKRWHPSRDFTSIGNKNIAKTMNKELFQAADGW
jgi:hypothetical protein